MRRLSAYLLLAMCSLLFVGAASIAYSVATGLLPWTYLAFVPVLGLSGDVALLLGLSLLGFGRLRRRFGGMSVLVSRFRRR